MCFSCMEIIICVGRFGLPCGSVVKNLPTVQETQVQFLGWEDPVEEKMATYSSVLAWKFPWTEEPGGLQSKGSQESDMTYQLSMHMRRKIWLKRLFDVTIGNTSTRMVPKITAHGDCSHEIKRCLLLGRKAMINLDSILKSRDITLLTKVCLVKAMFSPVVMYGC